MSRDSEKPSRSEVVAVVVGDAHLQPRAWAHVSAEGDAYYSFTQAVSLALKHDVPLILCGDNFDRVPNNPDPIAFFLKEAARLDERGLEVFYVQGQHDAYVRPWPSLAPNARHLHGRTTRVRGVNVYGLDFRPPGRLQEALDAVPGGVDVLITHQTWLDWMGAHCRPQGAFSDIPRVETVISGDYHKRVSVSTRGKSGQALAVHSLGSICLQDIGEEPEKYVGLLRREGGGLRLEAVRLVTRFRYESPLLVTQDDADKYVAELPSLAARWELDAAGQFLPPHIAKPLLRVYYSTELRDVARRVQRVVDDRAFLFLKQYHPERAVRSGRVVGDASVLTLQNCLAEVVDPDKDVEFYRIALRLLDDEVDPDAELDRWLKEQLDEV